MFGREFWQHSERCDIAGAIVPAISITSSRPAPKTSPSIAHLLVKGGSLLEADGVVLVLVGDSDRHGLSLDLGVEPTECALVEFNGARMDCNLGCVLVVDDAQLERIGVVQANDIVGSSVRVHWLAMRGMWWSGFWMAVASGTRI